MNRISTKIIMLSLANTLIVAILNVAASLYMNNNQQNTLSTDVTGMPEGLPATHQFLLPTAVLVGLFISLVLGVIISYILGKYIAKPILKVTELTRKTADFDLIDDESLEQALKYKDESGLMAEALSDTRTALKQMAVKL